MSKQSEEDEDNDQAEAEDEDNDQEMMDVDGGEMDIEEGAIMGFLLLPTLISQRDNGFFTSSNAIMGFLLDFAQAFTSSNMISSWSWKRC